MAKRRPRQLTKKEKEALESADGGTAAVTPKRQEAAGETPRCPYCQAEGKMVHSEVVPETDPQVRRRRYKCRNEKSCGYTWKVLVPTAARGHRNSTEAFEKSFKAACPECSEEHTLRLQGTKPHGRMDYPATVDCPCGTRLHLEYPRTPESWPHPEAAVVTSTERTETS